MEAFLSLLLCQLLLADRSAGPDGHGMKLEDFLSSHSSKEKVVDIRVEPKTVYVEEGRHAQLLNFDFVLEGLTDRQLLIRFIKVGVYDNQNRLLTFRFLNHNAVGTPGIHTIGTQTITGREKRDVFNPFFEFPKDVKIGHLRYTFTFADTETGEEFYYGNILVRPVEYRQRVRLSLPLKGLMVVTDGHDFYSHHRRFAMTIARAVTSNSFQSNSSRFALDLTLVGGDGNMRSMADAERLGNYDFHFTDVKKFHTDGATVYAPADGEVVEVVNDRDDCYEKPFDFDAAVKANRVRDIAGNRVVLKHNEGEYSHLFHLMKGSVKALAGQRVKRGEELGRVGFSGASTVYSHVHYQLLDGKDFLKDEPLPARFSDVVLVAGGTARRHERVALDTGDFVRN